MGWNNEAVAIRFIESILAALPEGEFRRVRDWMVALEDGPTRALLLIAHILLDFKDEESWIFIVQHACEWCEGRLRACAAEPPSRSAPAGAKEDG
ncbi:MAG: hypothetical protein JOZ63_13975 [Planctomycetaceae bacterium]|nr:hypothetical protein [Planctomycetaceae bacterium]MBV8383712.1 hypothetical protein [Planctomycetaceae bacterium]MBV8609656.1 hypothetical protein [Singulisphaera sp.]